MTKTIEPQGYNISNDLVKKILVMDGAEDYKWAKYYLMTWIQGSLEQFRYEAIIPAVLFQASRVVEHLILELIQARISKEFVIYLESDVMNMSQDDFDAYAKQDFVIEDKNQQNTIMVNWPRIITFIKENGVQLGWLSAQSSL